MRLDCVPGDWAAWAQVEPLARTAAAGLGLGERLEAVTLVADDLAPSDPPWIEFPARGVAEVYCHPEQFAVAAALGEGRPPRALPWELGDPPESEAARRFSHNGAARFLHHQFMALIDLVDGVVLPQRIPAGLEGAFQQIWAVSIDGRLRGRGLPGHPGAERRRRFFRACSGGGLLLPKHWELFHRAWDDPEPDHATLLEWAAELPTAGQAPEVQD